MHDSKGASIEIHDLSPLADPRWAQMLNSHSNASIFHSAGWLRALQTTYGYEPLAYTSAPPGTPLSNAVVFCRVNSWLTGKRLVSLPFSDHCEPLVDSVDQLPSRVQLFARSNGELHHFAAPWDRFVRRVRQFELDLVRTGG